MLETLEHTIRIGSTPTFLYFDLYSYCILVIVIFSWGSTLFDHQSHVKIIYLIYVTK